MWFCQWEANLFLWKGNDKMKRKVIIDCDPGIDDSLALMLALSCEEIEVIGITIVAGNSPLTLGFENAKRILAHMDRLDIPVYQGAVQPLVKPFINALDTHGEDGLGESFLPEIQGYQQEKDAVTFLKETLHKTPCSLIALGPMTNLAHLIQEDRSAFEKIDRLVSMGGSFKAHGNCSPVAEYNYWEDPHAAQMVYQTLYEMHKKIEMVGLDVTRQIVLTPDLLEYSKRLDWKQGSFIQKITKFYFDFHWEWEHLIGCVINDPLAIAYFIDPSLCQGFDAYTAIETEGISQGQSVVDAYAFYKKEANAHILNQVNVKAFFYLFYQKLFRCSMSDLDLLETFFKEKN